MNNQSHYGPMLDIGLAATTPFPLDIKIESANGVWLNCEGGGRLFDAISGIGVNNFGHANETIKSALHKQIDKNLHTMVYGEFRHDSTIEAAELLSAILPNSLDTTYFVNSGAEAIEGALKLAKRVTSRTRIIAFEGGYHGNTSGALSVSSNKERKAPFLPLLPEISFINFNNQIDLDCIDDTVACVILETVQGDAGLVIPSKVWLTELREKCNETGALLIMDEVQCGMGRCGSAFAFEKYNVVPDILCLGKALGGGMPIGAFVSSKEHMSLLSHSPTLGHITTFGGHPVACAGAVAALKLLSEIDWVEIEQRGMKWELRLRANPIIKSVRRIGYFFAIEMEDEETVTKAILKGIEVGVLMFWFLSVPNAFRLSPPLTMTEEESEQGLTMIEQSLINL
jgi:acetylornithine/succinyldiaminopimelate/putrescine aminotransferase